MKKKFRLKKSHEIAKVVLNKQRFAGQHYTIYYMKRDDGVKIAISAGKKYGNAVERNYAKRVIREILRPYLKKLPSYSLVIVVKETSKKLSFIEKKESLEKILKLLLRKENNKNEQKI